MGGTRESGGREDSRIPLARPAIGDAERAAADRALASGWLVTGPENQQFENALANQTGRAHAVCVASGTAALELSLWAMGLAAGDEVLVTSFGFIAAANAVARLGAVPVPVDVMRPTWTMDLESARAAITERTRGIVSIDQLGVAAEPSAIEALAAEHGLWLIDDAACGLGAVCSDGKPGAGFGDLATLSFHPRKVVTTGEGGAIVTDDAELAAQLRQLRNHGQVGRGVFARVGTNARLSELAAAIGSVQLTRLEAMLAERRLLAKGYRDRLTALADEGAVSWQDPVPGAMSSYQTFAIELGAKRDRAAVIASLAERQIESGPATYAFHRLGTFANSPCARALPVADALHDRALALPLYIGMRSSELDRVAELLGEVLA